MIFDLFLGWLGIYRRFRGGLWARSTRKAEVGRGLWVPYNEPVSEEGFWALVEKGHFKADDFRKNRPNKSALEEK